MSDTETTPNGRVPTLVQLCQRVAAASIDSIMTLGDDLSYPLVKPVLERCTVEQLLKLEEASPHLQDDTIEIWMQLCIRKYPSAVEKYLDDDSLEPLSWRERYMTLKHEEERRFELLGSKLKAQRMEADERKKEREVKLTDKVPPAKRPRTGGWGAPSQPKTLLQKTLSEASKIQKTMYTSRKNPPISGGRSHRVLPNPSWPSMPVTNSAASNRVSVNTVHKRPISGPSTTNLPSRTSPTTPLPPPSVSQSSSSLTLRNSRPTSGAILPRTTTITTTPPRQSGNTPIKNPPATPFSSVSPDTHSAKQIPVSFKKDPMSSLFVPKHRAHSQRPV